MRRNYISPEFDYSRVYGTFNMIEESSLFSSKMLEIEDIIDIGTQNLIYYQALSKEQIDLTVESSLPPISYSSSDDKRLNHTISLDLTQGPNQKETNTKWNLKIYLKDILTNYIFATLKSHRTFEGVRNTMTKNGDVDFAIKEYVVKNVLDRYKINRIELYINYVDIKGQNVLRYNNIWAGYTDPITNRTAITTDVIVNKTYQMAKFQTQTEFDETTTILTFNQDKKSSEYCFDYFFKLIYEKI